MLDKRNGIVTYLCLESHIEIAERGVQDIY